MERLDALLQYADDLEVERPFGLGTIDAAQYASMIDSEADVVDAMEQLVCVLILMSVGPKQVFWFVCAAYGSVTVYCERLPVSQVGGRKRWSRLRTAWIVCAI